MKFNKFIWCGIAAVVIGGFTAFNVSLNSQNNNDLSSISMLNAEALATESGTAKKCYAGLYSDEAVKALICMGGCVNYDYVDTVKQNCQ
jgi:hypothetical protein